MISQLVIPITIQELVKEEFDEKVAIRIWKVVRKWVADHCYIFVGHPDGGVTVLPSDNTTTRKDFSKLTADLIQMVDEYKDYKDYKDLIITLAHGTMCSITDARNMRDITIKPEQILDSEIRYTGDGVALIFFKINPNESATKYVF